LPIILWNGYRNATAYPKVNDGVQASYSCWANCKPTLRDYLGRVMLVAPPAPSHACGERIGESISPSANPILRELGIWPTFLAEAHLESQRSFSAWATPQLIAQSNQASGGLHGSTHGQQFGLSLDRRRFERFLWQKCELAHGPERSTQCQPQRQRCPAKVRAIANAQDGWCVQTDAGRTLQARFVIDCFGRAAVLARHLSVRHRADHLVAAYTFLTQLDTDVEPTVAVMIEAVAHGWWYSAVTPARQLVLALFSDVDLLSPHLPQDVAQWHVLVQPAPYTWQRVTSAGYALAGDDAPLAEYADTLQRSMDIYRNELNAGAVYIEIGIYFLGICKFSKNMSTANLVRRY
jgi:hypothetical protein